MKRFILIVSFFSLVITLHSCQDYRDQPVDRQRQERNATEPALPGPGGGADR
jgi:hypothetical protein